MNREQRGTGERGERAQLKRAGQRVDRTGAGDVQDQAEDAVRHHAADQRFDEREREIGGNADAEAEGRGGVMREAAAGEEELVVEDARAAEERRVQRRGERGEQAEHHQGGQGARCARRQGHEWEPKKKRHPRVPFP
jgi:hypothetical protein